MKTPKNQQLACELRSHEQETVRIETGNQVDEPILSQLEAKTAASESPAAGKGDNAPVLQDPSERGRNGDMDEIFNLEHLEPICEDFETAWRLENKPQFDDFLDRADELDRDHLLIELLQIELWWRREEHPTPTAEEYKQLLPQHDNAIDTAFRRYQNKSLVQAPKTSHDGPPQTLNTNARSEVYPATWFNPATQPPSDLATSGTPIDAPRTSGGLAPGTVIGDHELMGEIARGGMGVVYKARHIQLNRIVAFKVILGGQFASEDAMERFRTEAKATAQIDHPGIVPIYEIGKHDGQPYFTMGFVDGESLQERIDRDPLPPKEAANIVLAVAKAIHFAHQYGVIHRDLKPANILIDSSGEPRVTDFGLAKQVDETLAITKTGAVMGTPAYMPPEQAIGKTNAIDCRSDVYGLGAVLYAMLAGRPPFTGASTTDVLLQVIDADPISPQQMNRKIDRDLSTICMKCLQKEKYQRYDSAGDLATDLGRYLSNRPISARPIGRIGRGFRWCKRHKAQTFWFAAFLASLLYPLMLGLYGILTLYAAPFSVTTPDGSQISVIKPESTFGPVVEMATIDPDGNLVQQPVAVLPGIHTSRMTEAEELVDFAFEEPLIIRFQSGRISNDTFRTGGKIKVWIELLQYGEPINVMSPHIFDLRADPNDPALHQANFILLRSERDDQGDEVWNLSMQSRVDRAIAQQVTSESRRAISPIAEASIVKKQRSESGRSTKKGFSYRFKPSVWTEPQSFTDSQLRDLVNAKLGANAFEEHCGNISMSLLRSMTIKTSTNLGTVNATGEAQTLYQQRMGRLLNLERILKQKGTPIDTELAEVEFHIKCQFLPEQTIVEEAQAQTADQADADQADADQADADQADADQLDTDATPTDSQ
ncbi:MAG: serine/threonine protein kinase [Rubripirellula sp.]